MHFSSFLNLARIAIVFTWGACSSAATIALSGGTIISFDEKTDSLDVIRNGTIIIEDDRIQSISEGDSAPSNAQVLDVSGKILTPGFIDTHRHGWQTAFKTLASNTTLAEYFLRYSEFVAGKYYTAEDVYLSQLAGLYEALNAGVTTMLDHAHHTWSPKTSEAGLRASIDSGARVFWAYAFHNTTQWSFDDQVPDFRDIATKGSFKGTATSLGIAYDYWGVDQDEVKTLTNLIKDLDVSVLTTHAVGGPWGVINSPTVLQQLGLLDLPVPIVFSHGSFLTFDDARLLRQSNQHLSITPESEMHYGHGHPTSHLMQDQASLGVDTHFTYSTDILTQARIWLQSARITLFNVVLSLWEIPRNNPMSANQAFLLATRQGGLALHRTDLGIIAPGAKADIVAWDGDSPGMLGWDDPVAAVMLHANVGDIDHVLVDGKFVKRDGKLVAQDYDQVKSRFLDTARRIQNTWKQMPLPELAGDFQSGASYADTLTVDVQRGNGTGYGQLFL